MQQNAAGINKSVILICKCAMFGTALIQYGIIHLHCLLGPCLDSWNAQLFLHMIRACVKASIKLLLLFIILQISLRRPPWFASQIIMHSYSFFIQSTDDSNCSEHRQHAVCRNAPLLCILVGPGTGGWTNILRPRARIIITDGQVVALFLACSLRWKPDGLDLFRHLCIQHMTR